MDYSKIELYVKEGLVSERFHPHDSDVAIYNYTPMCAFKEAWDDVTMACRGLILNKKTGEKLSNPFPKFFNYGQYKGEIPNEVPFVQKKQDGSLAILYYLKDSPYIATRGSFESEQAKWATSYFRANYSDIELDRTKTFLWEIIFPENRIVLHYDFSGLVLLAIRDIETGDENPEELFKYKEVFRLPETVSPMDFDELAKLEKPNEEGFVVFYPKAKLRVKVKFAEYLLRHRLISSLSPRAIWELMETGGDIDILIGGVGDEFFAGIRKIRDDLQSKFDLICSDAIKDYASIKIEGFSRKEIALQIVKMRFPVLLFGMLDNKNWKHSVWKLIKPRGEAAEIPVVEL